MATQIVMAASGDSRHSLDPADEIALLGAEDRFRELLKNGYTAASRNGSGPVTVTRTFDPTVEETLFYPRLVGMTGSAVIFCSISFAVVCYVAGFGSAFSVPEVLVSSEASGSSRNGCRRISWSRLTERSRSSS
jgi:hypothetical protein